MKLRGLTIIEILVVVVITGVLLSMTLYMGWDYIKTMQVRTDKELFANSFERAFVTARTSNYFAGEKYDEITITITGEGISAFIDIDRVVSSHTLKDAEVVDVGSGYPTFLIEPYSIGCSIYLDESLESSVDFMLESNINNDVYCYHVEATTCKLQQVSCD